MNTTNNLLEVFAASGDISLDLKEPPIFPVFNSSFERVKSYYSNGLFKYIKDINLGLTVDIEKCKDLWNKFSPDRSIFDVWEFRYAFHTSYKCVPIFITVNRGLEPVAMLPLCYDPQVKGFRWFGTSWQEDNRFYSEEGNYIPLMLFYAPTPLKLFAINEEDAKRVPKFVPLEIDDPKFILNLEGKKTIEDYLMSLKKKKRHNLRRDFNHIKNMKPKVLIDNFSDYDEMVLITEKRFRQKGEVADWEEEPQSIETFKRIMFNKTFKYQRRMISVYINDKLAAADLIAIKNDKYFTLKGGYNTKDFSGVGNYLNILEIEEAINMKMEYIDFLQLDFGWKSSMVQPTSLFRYEVD